MNKSTRKPVTCYCDFTACMQCCKKYLLEESVTEPKCMKCNVGWTIEFIVNNMNRSFYIKDFRLHMAQVMMDKEKAYLPAAQVQAEETKLIRIHSKKLKNLKNDIIEMKLILDDVREEYRTCLININRDEEEFKKIKKEYIDYREGILRMEIEKEECEFMIAYINHNPIKVYDTERKKFMMHCRTEECRGFLSTQWKCELCEKYTCNNCLESIGTFEEKKSEKHKCKKEDVESAELIKKETKACPSCGVPITRILGCASMFCVECNTGFNWNSLKIQTGNIDNPHYIEWRNKQTGPRRTMGDLPCGGLPFSIPDEIRYCGPELYDFMTDLLQSVSHVSRIVMGRYIPVGDNKLLDLRVKYLLGEITEAQWMLKLAIIQKTNSFRHCVTQVLQMYTYTMVHLFRNLVESPSFKKGIIPKNKREIYDMCKEIILLWDYSDSELNKIHEVYKQVVPRLFGEYNTADLDRMDKYVIWAKEKLE
jgi:hypothetical protein